MKKESISVQMEAEKLRATRKYMEKKDANIEQELADALLKLYEKYVPAAVREYIDESVLEQAKPSKSTRPKEQKTTMPTNQV